MKIDIRNAFHAVKDFVKDHISEIMVIGGVGGMIAGEVMSCKATTKLPEVKETSIARIDAIEETTYTSDNEKKKELMKAHMRNIWDYAKLYGPSVVVNGLSVSSILTGNNILRKRNLALAAAYTTLDASYKQYRMRVMERYGEEAEFEIRNNIHQRKVEETIVDENGKTRKVKKTIDVASSHINDYARYFEQGASNAWEPNEDYNMFFLRGQQKAANDRLRHYGVLLLNDVYDMLGIDRSLAGTTVGWIYDRNSNAEGDNYVDFRIRKINRDDPNDPRGYSETILLDFNVDGNVLNRAKELELLK